MRTHGRRGGDSRKHDRTYSSWIEMRRRCVDNTRRSFPDYGGRGISVCSRWGKFELFLADMGERPLGHTLGRIDNADGYYLENCRWETAREQARNRTNNVLNFERAAMIAKEIRSGISKQKIADAFGVSRALVRKIADGKAWPDAMAAATKFELGE